MSKGEETRRAILEEALSMASQLGLESVSIGALAKAVGMSKSGLFAHFDSKEQLQIQILQETSERFVAAVLMPALKAPRGEPRVRALLDRWQAWSESPFLPGGCIFLHAAVELDDRPGPARDFLAATQRDWLDTLAQAARVAKQEGHFRADLDEKRFAFQLYGLYLAYHQVHRLIRDPEARDRLRQSLEELIQRAHPA